MLKIILQYIGFISLLLDMPYTLMANLSICDSINYQAVPKYYLFKKHARSDGAITIQTNLSSLRKCKNLAVSKKGLAFNFNPTSSISKRTPNNYPYNCQVLNCPDIYASTSLIRDQRYNYYSLYPHPLLPVRHNANYIIICVPRAGLFLYSEVRKNYTEAQKTCQNMYGTLAHIISQERTQGLAKFIDSPTFIGLSNNGKERTWINEFGEPLSCFQYRAWAKGEPTNSRGCTVLVKDKYNGQDSQPFWRVVLCSRKLKFFCEILPLKSKTLQKT